MPGIGKGLAYIGIWLACSSIVLDATNPQDSVSELSSENNSATRAQARSFLDISHHLGLGNCSDSQDQHRVIGIHFGSGHIIQQHDSIEKEKKETESSEMSRNPPKLEEQGDESAAAVKGFEVKSSKFIDRLEELTNESIATTQELRSSFDYISARIASIDRSLAGIAELTNKSLARSEQMLSTYNSTRMQLEETESSLCPYSTSGSSASGSKSLPNDCWEIYQSGCHVSGIYKIRPGMPFVDAFSVYCEMDARGGGWTVLQNRMDGSVNFFQKWYRYKNGFGSLDGEFWLGLERMHQLTNSKSYQLLIELEDFDGETRFAVYDNFVVSSEDEKYSLQQLGNYAGTAGDSLSYHEGKKFSTWDQDNDGYSNLNCASKNGGGWWFYYCAFAMLNGDYLEGRFASDENRVGIEWEAWRGKRYSYRKSRMSISPLQFVEDRAINSSG